MTNPLGLKFRGEGNRNLSSAELVEQAILNHEGQLSATGTLIVNTGTFTGRSPKDKYIVDYGKAADREIAWGAVNNSISPEHFESIFRKVKKHLENQKVYVQDVYVGNHPEYKKNIRIITEKAWAALFSRDLFLVQDQPVFENPDFTVLHVPDLLADPAMDGTVSGTFIILNYQENVVLIGGTAYAGEIKKSVFSIMNRILPGIDVLPMHCSANINGQNETALFFGLSGTGKTTLSSSPDRQLIGDDEHGWADDGIFNFEGGCYAKTINLRQDLEPLIWSACQRFGSVLENVGFNEKTRKIDFDDGSRTENTRAAYPLEFIPGRFQDSIATHPNHIFFLSADAFGVLPPISLLSSDQAIYYFLLGYTSKLAGTEKGLGKEPEATFSTCFGEPFLPLYPQVYARMLKKRLDAYQPKVWLVNTGWSGGPYDVGARIKLPYSRLLVNSALYGNLERTTFHIDPIFGVSVPDHVEGIPDDILDPIRTWHNKDDFKIKADNLKNKMDARYSDFLR